MLKHFCFLMPIIIFILFCFLFCIFKTLILAVTSDILPESELDKNPPSIVCQIRPKRMQCTQGWVCYLPSFHALIYNEMESSCEYDDQESQPSTGISAKKHESLPIQDKGITVQDTSTPSYGVCCNCVGPVHPREHQEGGNGATSVCTFRSWRLPAHK